MSQRGAGKIAYRPVGAPGGSEEQPGTLSPTREVAREVEKLEAADIIEKVS